MREAFALRSPAASDRWTGDAAFSMCGRYRLWLTRHAPSSDLVVPRLVWIMLNPSAAGKNPNGDPRHDDPTIRKCIGFARRWGYDAFTVVNLFDLIATDPDDLWRAPTFTQVHEGLEWKINDTIYRSAVDASLVVCAWGSSGGPLAAARGRDVVRMLGDRGRRADDRLHCLGRTKGGEPRHPVRLGYDTALEPYGVSRG